MKTTIFLSFTVLFFCGTFAQVQYNAPSYHQFNSNYGNIQIGALNPNWLHLYTDRPAVIFNKPIYSIGGKFSSYSTDNLYLQTNSISRLAIINSNGYVGIGTINPSSLLTVNGNISSNSLKIVNHETSDWSYASYIKVDRDLTKAFVISDKNSNEVFRIYGNGIVYSKKVVAEAFEVRPDAANISWYDSVFSLNYELMPLFDVEKYIKQYSHLPDIPSENVVKSQGFNLAEMDGLLLKKIEELTLYVISLQKEIESLKLKVKK